MFDFNKECRDAVKEEAKSKFPNESGGFIVADGGKNIYKIFSNNAKDKKNEYQIDPVEYEDLLTSGNIKALVHTHCLADYNLWNFGHGRHPSSSDIKTQIEWDIPSIILPVLKYEDSFYFDDFIFLGVEDKDDIKPLYDRGFRFGVYDCWNFCRDWLYINQNKRPPNVPRDWNFWINGYDSYSELLGQKCFLDLDVEEIEEGDIMLFKLPNLDIANHGGIYLNGGVVAHHAGTRKPVNNKDRPKKDLFNRWKKYIVKLARYVDNA